MSDTSYRFGVPQVRNNLVGLSVPMIAGMAAFGILAIASFILGTTPIAAVVLIALGVAWGFLPIGNKMAYEWAIPLGHFFKSEHAGTRTWRSPRTLARLGSGLPKIRIPLPPELEGVKFVSYADNGVGMAIGIEKERSAFLMTAVFRVSREDNFQLAEIDEQASAIAQWGSVLSSTAVERTRVERLCWLERSFPDSGEEQQRWFASNRPEEDSEGLEDYESWLNSATRYSRRHEVFVGLQVKSHKKEEKEALAEAGEEWRSFASRLAESGLFGTPVGAKEMVGLFRTFADPMAASIEEAYPRRRISLATMGPRSRKSMWDHLRVESSFQRYWLVAEWPRTPVAANWMEPLLLSHVGDAVRTVTMVLEPVPLRKALSSVVQSQVRAEASDAARRERGQIQRANAARASEELALREEELVAGYPEHRIAAVIGLAAASKDSLEEATGSLIGAATKSQLRLDGLEGYQEEGWAAALPLCRLRFKRV